MVSLRTLALLVFLFSTNASVGFAQWTQIASFPSFVRVIRFLDSPGASHIGFLGTGLGHVFKTTDYGATWIQSSINTGNVSVSEFTFKDSTTGWLTTKVLSSGSVNGEVFMTHDGGLNWVALNHTGTLSSIYYNRSSKLLFLSDWNAGELVSNDEGQTFNVLSTGTYFNGIQFPNDQNGIIAAAGSGGFVLVTTDAGLTWANVGPDDETWQPASSATGNFYELSEITNRVYRSTDQGHNWSFRYRFSSGFATGLTGCLRASSCDDIFTQSLNEGFFLSTDEGDSWTAFGGPGNAIDSRFWISDSKIFAGDTGGGLFTHPLPSKASFDILPANIEYQIVSCPTQDSILHFDVSSCSGIGDSLIDANILGSSRFKLVNTLALPRKTFVNDSLTIEYTPSLSNHDSSTLVLRFLVGGKTIDTVVPLVARHMRQPEQLHPIIRFDSDKKAVSIVAPEKIDAVIALDDTLTAPTFLTDLDVFLHYDSDALTQLGIITTYQGWVASNLSQQTGILSFHLHRTIIARIEKDSALARIKFSSSVSPNAFSPISISQFLYNQDTMATDNCTYLLSSKHDSVMVNIGSICSDSTLRTALRGEPVLLLLGISPNPASDHLNVSIQLPQASEIDVILEDMLGRIVAILHQGELTTGVHELSLPFKLPSGIYNVGITVNGAAQVNARMVVAK